MRLRLALLAAALAVGLAGCGGGSEVASDRAAALAARGAMIAPEVVGGPHNAVVGTGERATFQVYVVGSEPLSYQWRRRNEPIAGANGSQFITDSTSADDDRSHYTVVVSNAAGSVTSRFATLSVVAPVEPSLEVVPLSDRVEIGESATFSVVASGTAPLRYRWYRNGDPISGATRDRYTTPPARAADDGAAYHVEVRNASGSVRSRPARIRISPPAAFPRRPIRMIVTTSQDTPARIVAEELARRMTKLLGQPVEVETVAGGLSATAANRVAGAPADGYTLLFSDSGFATAPMFTSLSKYDPLRDFEFLGLLTDTPLVLVGRPSLGAKTMKALRAQLGKPTDPPVLFAHGGMGNVGFLCSAALEQQIGVEMTLVPYNGAKSAITDVTDGSADLACELPSFAMPFAESKQVRAYATTGAERSSLTSLMKLPTVDSSGGDGFRVTSWMGLYAPRGTPESAVRKLNRALRAVLKQTDFIRIIESRRIELVKDARTVPEQHRKFVGRELRRWRALIEGGGS